MSGTLESRLRDRDRRYDFHIERVRWTRLAQDKPQLVWNNLIRGSAADNARLSPVDSDAAISEGIEVGGRLI